MEKPDYIESIEGGERRFAAVPVGVEMRVDNDGTEKAVINGIAAKVGSRTDLGYFDEIIEAGAFDDCLQDDVRCLFNHDPNQILARTKANTLEISIDEDGHLRYSYETPDVSYAKDLEENIRLGNVTQSSFAFTIQEQNWTEPQGEENHLRTILKVDRLFDVSPVTYPAYQDTEVGVARSWSDYEKDLEKRNKENTNETPPIGLVVKQLQINKNRKQ